VPVNRRMRSRRIFDLLALVSRKVVGDHVDFFAARLIDGMRSIKHVEGGILHRLCS
jgi:hypothetical protein